jgi:DNA-binding GntR family transcriptional regulator
MRPQVSMAACGGIAHSCRSLVLVSERYEHGGHVFISYVREDTGRVEQLQQRLESAEIRVWRDTLSLWPGQNWAEMIKRAITDDALIFLACFSSQSVKREKSYQTEELMLAIDQLRLRRPDVPWLFPIRFDDCAIPNYDIGGGRTLDSIQGADLFGDNLEKETERLIKAVRAILGPHSISPSSRWRDGAPRGAPVHQLIADDLISQIQSGKLPPGERLKQPDLMRRYDVSRNTIRTALSALTRMGWTEAGPSREIIVAGQLEPVVITLTADWSPDRIFGAEADRREVRTDAYVVAIQQASRQLAEHLRLNEDLIVVGRSTKYWVDGRRWALQTNFFPHELVTRGADRLLGSADIVEGTTPYLQEALGIKSIRHRNDFTARPADKQEEEYFQIPEGRQCQIFEIYSIETDDEGKVIRLAVTRLPADRNRISTG